jgi:hypothetical protein
MRHIASRACALALLGWTACAGSQDEMPALPDEQPAISTEEPALSPEPEAAPQKPGGVQKARTGTTVIGEQEAPLGLYIMPWRQSQAQAGLDRPARLLDEALLPLDPEVFKRQVEYHRALSEHLAKTGKSTP